MTTTTRAHSQHHDTSPTTTPNEHSQHQPHDLHNDHQHDHHDDHQHEQNQEHDTTNDTTTSDQDPSNYEDPQAEHTQASGAPGDLREPWRAAQEINYKIHNRAGCSTSVEQDSRRPAAELSTRFDRGDRSC